MSERKDFKKGKRMKELRLPLLALGLELACPILFLLSGVVDDLFSFFGFSAGWGVLLRLALILCGIIVPIAGVALTPQAFLEAKKNKNGAGIFLSLIAFLLPILGLAYVIFMFSTGVWVIRFM